MFIKYRTRCSANGSSLPHAKRKAPAFIITYFNMQGKALLLALTKRDASPNK